MPLILNMLKRNLKLLGGFIGNGKPPLCTRAWLKKIHTSHMGADNNYRMCRDILYWPKMKSAFQDICSSCGQCAQYGAQHAREPMQSMPIPQCPWQFVSQDIFHGKSSAYLLTVIFGLL